MVFVLKETQPEAWISNGGDFTAYLKPPGVQEVVDQVQDLRMSYFLITVAEQKFRIALRPHSSCNSVSDVACSGVLRC